MSQIVYVFVNEAMPGYIKIGMTTRESLKGRLDTLSSHTGVPLPFECLYAAEVDDAKKVEDALHEAFDCDRPNKKREFFKTAPDRIITLLKAFAKSDESVLVQNQLDTCTSPEERQAANRVAEENIRRSNLSFSAIDVPIGAELVFTKDETKKCRVAADHKNLEYEGRSWSLTALAKKFLLEIGITYATQGAYWFRYEGERLTERRERMEREAEE